MHTHERLVIWNHKGRKAEVLDRYYAGIGEEGCQRYAPYGAYQRIESVALDGAKHYISSTSRYAVNALIVYDRFHIMQKLNPSTLLRVDSERSRRVNWAVDMVGKEELRKARADENNELVELINCRSQDADFAQRFILLKNPAFGGTEKQANYLQRLCEINQPIYQAMLLKGSFLQIYSYSEIETLQIFSHS